MAYPPLPSTTVPVLGPDGQLTLPWRRWLQNLSGSGTLTPEQIAALEAAILAAQATADEALALAAEALAQAGSGASDAAGLLGVSMLDLNLQAGPGIILSPNPIIGGTAVISRDPGVMAGIGLDGESGEDGPPGPPGAPGAAGPAGPAGAAGVAGPPGFDGVDGLDGPPGPPGPAGAAGANGAVGPQGPIGWGMDGLDGADGMPIPGPQGPAGPTGPAGATGPSGDIGVPGFDGEDGPEGFAAPYPLMPVARAITFALDGNASVLTTGTKADVYVPYACTIIAVTLIADQSGSVVLGISKSSYSGFPGSLSSIVASAAPTLSSAQKSQDTTLTGWTTSIRAGDVLEFSVTSASTITRVNCVLTVLV